MEERECAHFPTGFALIELEWVSLCELEWVCLCVCVSVCVCVYIHNGSNGIVKKRSVRMLR